MMTAVGIMVGSFRETVIQWMEGEVPADFYLRPAGKPFRGPPSDNSPLLADNIAALPGVEAWTGFVLRGELRRSTHHSGCGRLAGREKTRKK